MKYSTPKIAFLATIIVSSSMPSIMIWESIPKETFSEYLILFAKALGMWAVISVLVFILFGGFIALIAGVINYVRDRIYRTPTL